MTTISWTSPKKSTEYVICAICPVTLTKPGLGYRKEENRIGTMDRDWMVGMPETGFTFPAFSERSTDIHAVMFYTKDTKSPHEEVIKNVLGCQIKRTATQKQIALTEIIKENVDEEKHEDVIIAVQEKLSEAVEEQEAPIITGDDIAKIMMESGIPETNVKTIENRYNETFTDELPEAESLIDAKVLKAYEAKVARLELEAEVEELKKQLEEVKTESDSSTEPGVEVSETEAEEAEAFQENNIVVNVNREKKSRFVRK